MKGPALYAIAILAGGGIGAVGAGSYVVFMGDGFATDGMPADTTHVEDTTAAPEGTSAPTSTRLSAAERAAAEEAAAEAVAAIGESTTGDPDPVPVEPTESRSADEATVRGPGRPVVTGPAPAVPIPTPMAVAPDPDSLARAQANFQRLARIFAAMKPDEAAPVLSQLDDAQLEGILLAMQGRNAAPILAAMAPERAASISRRVLRGNE